PDQARVLESAAERVMPNMTQAAKEYVRGRERKRRQVIAERRAATTRAQIEEEYGALPPGDGARLCGFDRAELDVILDELQRSAQGYPALAAKMTQVYEPTLPRLAQKVVRAIHELPERLSLDAQALEHAVFSLRELLKDGPVPGDQIAQW